MTALSAVRPIPDAASRGSRQQPRAFGEGRRVRVLGEGDVLIDVCSPEQAARYVNATNAEVKRRKDGSIRLVRLVPMGDDRGHAGERHGRSTVTTERVKNDWGMLVGSSFNLKHKETASDWGAAAVTIQRQSRIG